MPSPESKTEANLLEGGLGHVYAVGHSTGAGLFLLKGTPRVQHSLCFFQKNPKGRDQRITLMLPWNCGAAMFRFKRGSPVQH